MIFKFFGFIAENVEIRNLYRVIAMNKKLLLAVSLSAFICANANADTIYEAMSEAYNSNPTLHGQRAASGATNEDAAAARSGFRPTIGVNGNYSDTHVRKTGSNTVDGYQKGYNGSITQPIFNGFSTYNAVKAADSAAKAGIQDLYAVEQTVLLGASTAYLDVMRDEAIVRLQKNNERLLKKQLDETLARFDVGEVTRTDVAQSRASYAQSQSDVISAEGNLAISKATYLQIIGKEPKDLQNPASITKMFPTRFDEAMNYARSNNYSLLAAKKQLDSASYNVNSNKGALLPDVSFTASSGKTTQSNHDMAKNPSTTSTQYSLDMNVPLYTGGATRAKIRKSKYQKWQAQEGVLEAERAVVAGVTSYWQSMQANKSNITSIQAQVKASAIALEGTQKEEALGNRTVLDVLNAYQTLLTSQVNEVKALHDYYVSGLQLMQSMGKLTAQKLALKVNYYDAEGHYQNTKGKWLTLSIDK